MRRFGNKPFIEVTSHSKDEGKKYSPFLLKLDGKSLEDLFAEGQRYASGFKKTSWKDEPPNDEPCINGQEMYEISVNNYKECFKRNPGLWRDLILANGLSDIFCHNHRSQLHVLRDLKVEYTEILLSLLNSSLDFYNKLGIKICNSFNDELVKSDIDISRHWDGYVPKFLLNFMRVDWYEYYPESRMKELQQLEFEFMSNF